MEVTARLYEHRVSARKARAVADQIRGKGVEEALSTLTLSEKHVSKIIAKLVRSAIASVEQKNEREKAGIDVDTLVVRSIVVDEGPSLWRVRPRAQARAFWIQKRTSHITVVLGER